MTAAYQMIVVDFDLLVVFATIRMIVARQMIVVPVVALALMIV